MSANGTLLGDKCIHILHEPYFYSSVFVCKQKYLPGVRESYALSVVRELGIRQQLSPDITREDTAVRRRHHAMECPGVLSFRCILP